MDINTQNSSGMMNGMPPITPDNSKPEKKVGPIIGIFIIIIILIVAAFYFFGKKLNTDDTLPVETITSTEQTSAVTASQNSAPATSADDVDSLSAELEAQLQDVDYSF
ncbi:MAG: hypothetical protein AAB909_02340 [Patescibacteria group bacterium]